MRVEGACRFTRSRSLGWPVRPRAPTSGRCAATGRAAGSRCRKARRGGVVEEASGVFLLAPSLSLRLRREAALAGRPDHVHVAVAPGASFPPWAAVPCSRRSSANDWPPGGGGRSTRPSQEDAGRPTMACPGCPARATRGGSGAPGVGRSPGRSQLRSSGRFALDLDSSRPLPREGSPCSS